MMDRVKPSPQPDSWKLGEIFATGIILCAYMAMMVAHKTDFFPLTNNWHFSFF
uniref:Uncharacterized protein n=1 Tax=Rhizophora mucronata TaxID=61149 RepID=A0A2P2JC93_RHIMU